MKHYGIWIVLDGGDYAWLTDSSNMIFCTTSLDHAEAQKKACLSWDLARIRVFETGEISPVAGGSNRKKGLYLTRDRAEDMVDMLESLGRVKYWWAEEMAAELRKRYGMTEAKGEK